MFQQVDDCSVLYEPAMTCIQNCQQRPNHLTAPTQQQPATLPGNNWKRDEMMIETARDESVTNITQSLLQATETPTQPQTLPSHCHPCLSAWEHTLGDIWRKQLFNRVAKLPYKQERLTSVEWLQRQDDIVVAFWGSELSLHELLVHGQMLKETQRDFKPLWTPWRTQASG